MLAWSATLLLAVWACCSPSSARPQHFPPHPLAGFNARPPTASEIELQRVGRPVLPGSKSPVANTGDYSDAIYAAHLARELTRLEENKKNIYVDFISSLYMNPQAPYGFPADLQRLSRGAPSPHAPKRIISTSSSSSSFGPLPPAPFPGRPHPGAVGHGFPFARR